METRKLKIVISGVHYPMTMLLYFWRAFERRNDIDLIVTGPFYNNWIPWEFGKFLPVKYVKAPHIPLPPQMSQMQPNSIIVETQLPWKPDLWLQIDAGWHFCNKPKADIVALIETDPHVLKPWYIEAKKNSDVVFVMQDYYREPDEKFLPYANDPTLYYPEDLPKEYDGCLVGLHYPQRDQLVNLLRGMGFNIHYDMAKIYDEYRTAYNKSKVALSWSTLLDTPSRVWEGMGLRLPLLCNRTPDLNLFFKEGKDYLGFSDLGEAGRQFARLMADPDMAKEIAYNGYEIVKHNTWDDRVNIILSECELV